MAKNFCYVIQPIPNDRLLDKAKMIYMGAFPIAEQRPWEKLVKAYQTPFEGRPRFDGVFDGCEIIGLVTTWSFPEFYYVEHLAIESMMRGKRAGSVVMDCMKTRARDAGVPSVVEVEPGDTSDEAARRIQFYERNGLKVISKEYIQPPYRQDLPSVPMWLMATADLDPAIITPRLHREVYGASC